MLRKLNKKDPFSPRSYRPITLEETLGKLLEKIIANWLQFLANKEDWLPPNQSSSMPILEDSSAPSLRWTFKGSSTQCTRPSSTSNSCQWAVHSTWRTGAFPS
ncbi:hypothetical protein M0805_008879 [Coniferiporia weirii]|nr:hypothetical protein M0805_008879 [Coniferiporia weirii]